MREHVGGDLNRIAALKACRDERQASADHRVVDLARQASEDASGGFTQPKRRVRSTEPIQRGAALKSARDRAVEAAE